jgi:4-hydroxybenzoate polyprenyl transferase
MQLNLTTQVLGVCGLLPVIVYPLAKRYTNWPQSVLSTTFNWGALMGWSAIVCSSQVDMNIFGFLPALALYAGCWNWTMFYDTIYAFQDKVYDEKAGIKSSAITIQKNPYKYLSAFSAAATTNFAIFGYLTNQENIYYITLGLVLAHFVKQMAFVDFKSPQSCSKQFNSNNIIGMLVAFGLFASLVTK